MTTELILRLVAGLVLIGMNAFFVAVEFALTRLRGLEITEEELEASAGLRRAWELTERLEIHLTSCQLGISSSSVVFGVVAEPAVTRLIEPGIALLGIEGGSVRGISVVVAVVLMNLAHKIWGEQAPTYLGVERPRQVAARLAPALWLWSRLTKPVVLLGDGLAKATLGLFGVEITRSWTEAEVEEDVAESRGDLKRRMGELLARGEISQERREEVLQALEIGEIEAREIMIPVEEMVCLSLSASGDENRRRLAEGGYVRYPLAREDPGEGGPGGVPRDNVVGVIYVPALLDPPDRLQGDELGLEELAEDPVWLSPDISVAELIDRLQEARHELALLAEDDRVVGMVTIMDAFESIAGEVEDPLDASRDLDMPGGEDSG